MLVIQHCVNPSCRTSWVLNGGFESFGFEMSMFERPTHVMIAHTSREAAIRKKSFWDFLLESSHLNPVIRHPSTRGISIRSSINPFIHLPIHLFGRPSLFPPSIHPIIRASIHPSIHPCLHPSIHPIIHPSILLSIHPSFYPSFHKERASVSPVWKAFSRREKLWWWRWYRLNIDFEAMRF